MSDRSTWESEWRALAEKELRGAPLASLTPARHDGIALDPALGPDASREEGLADAPAARRSVVIASRIEDLRLAEGTDGVWWRARDEAPDDPRVLLVESAADPSLIEAVVTDASGSSRQSVIALTDVHESGGSVVTEVAIGVAALVELARRPSGPPPAFRFAVSVGPELFVEVAKLRALRRLCSRVLAALSIDASVWIAARTAQRSLARLDVATNVVRSTIGAAASMFGGADIVAVLPMELESPSPRSTRLARNVPQILVRESALNVVDDPARGSFEIEALTDRIARDAWDVVRDIENAGGLVAARALVRDRIARDAKARSSAVRSRRVPIVGVSKFVLASDRVEASPPDARDASPFEAARAAGAEAVDIVVVGTVDESRARVDFVRELLDVGGFTATADARIAVVCAPDALFATDVPKVIAEKTAHGVAVFVAGKPGAAEAALRAAGALGFIALGQDVTAFFAALRGAR